MLERARWVELVSEMACGKSIVDGYMYVVEGFEDDEVGA